MSDVIKVVDLVGSLSAIVVAVLIIAAIALPACMEWLKRRFAGELEVQKALLDLASDYYGRRLDCYLEIWRLTQETLRDVLNAANPRSSVDWDKASNRVAELKNTYWDNRPLFSSRVHVSVRRVSSFFDRALAHARMGVPGGPPEDGRERWRGLVREVKTIQGNLLSALAEDLQHSGLSAMILGAPGEDPGEPPTDTAVDAALTRLVNFVGHLQGRLPYVGSSYVQSNFYRTPDLDLTSLVDFAVSDGLLEGHDIYDEKHGRNVSALRVNLDSAQALEMLDPQDRATLSKR